MNKRQAKKALKKVFQSYLVIWKAEDGYYYRRTIEDWRQQHEWIRLAGRYHIPWRRSR